MHTKFGRKATSMELQYVIACHFTLLKRVVVTGNSNYRHIYSTASLIRSNWGGGEVILSSEAKGSYKNKK
jgi:hypothetical protein